MNGIAPALLLMIFCCFLAVCGLLYLYLIGICTDLENSLLSIYHSQRCVGLWVYVNVCEHLFCVYACMQTSQCVGARVNIHTDLSFLFAHNILRICVTFHVSMILTPP